MPPPDDLQASGRELKPPVLSQATWCPDPSAGIRTGRGAVDPLFARRLG